MDKGGQVTQSNEVVPILVDFIEKIFKDQLVKKQSVSFMVIDVLQMTGSIPLEWSYFSRLSIIIIVPG